MDFCAVMRAFTFRRSHIIWHNVHRLSEIELWITQTCFSWVSAQQ